MKKKSLILSISIFFILLIITVFFMINHTKAKMKDLFQMNKGLQEQGYYMAEFEFKMLGIAYYLDKGNYRRSLSLFNQLHNQLSTKKGLLKMPVFNSKEQELKFYLNLQNPNTGAFMDDSYPYCTYSGPTGNLLLHLNALAEETGQSFQLKYPLKYLDEINTPKKLKAYLDDVATVGWIASKLPQTSFHFARDVLSLYHEDNIIEKYDLYRVSPEWKQILRQWFYNNQDPETGLWGPKSKNGKLLKMDLSNTSSIIKAFVDKEGNNIYKTFPLRYKDELTDTILDELFKAIPKDDEFDQWHEWNLKAAKTLNTLINYLWNDLSPEKKNRTTAYLEKYIKLKFDKFYLPDQGAFSYYPHGEYATLDGTTNFFIFKKIGALSSKDQNRLWGGPKATIVNLGTVEISDIDKDIFDTIANSHGVNSLRVYKMLPDYSNLLSGILAIIYPKKISVLDIVDLTPKIIDWVKNTDQTMGNWISKAEIVRKLDLIKIDTIPIYENDIPTIDVKEVLRKNSSLTVIGFDILQVPRYKIVYKLKLNLK